MNNNKGPDMPLERDARSIEETDEMLRWFYAQERMLQQPSEALLKRLYQLPEEYPHTRQSPRQRWWGLVPALAIAALCLLMLRWPIGQKGSSSGQEMLAKGSQIQMFFVHSRTRLRRLASPGQPLFPGDLIQFSYKMPRKGLHLMIVSVDSKGQVSLYAPFGKAESSRLNTTRGWLPQKGRSIELDDSLGAELFLGFYAKKSFAFSRVRTMLQRSFRRASGKLTQLKIAHQRWQLIWRLMVQKTPRSKHRRSSQTGSK